MMSFSTEAVFLHGQINQDIKYLRTRRAFKIRLSSSKKMCVICVIENTLKMMKIVFYFILKALRCQDI